MCDGKANKLKGPGFLRMRNSPKKRKLNVNGEIEYITEYQTDNIDNNECIYENPDSAIATDIRTWTWNNRIENNHIDSLLKTLKPHIPDLPLTYKSLLRINPVESYTMEKFNQSHNSENNLQFDYIEVAQDDISVDQEGNYENNIKEPEETRKSSSLTNNINEDQLAIFIKKQFNAMQTSLVNHMNKKFQCLEYKIDKLTRLGTRVSSSGTDSLNSIKIDRSHVAEEDTIVTFHKLIDTYKYQFPLTTMEDFVTFDNHIKENHNLREDLKNHFMVIINADKSLKDNLTVICKKFLSRTVLMSHTSQKKKGDKPLFCETNFYDCLEEAVIYTYSLSTGEILEKKLILKDLGGVINNSIDWDGNRIKRAKLLKQDESS